MRITQDRRRWLLTATAGAVAGLLAACSSPPKPTVTVSEAISEPPSGPAVGAVSQARTARDYRRDAASHLYDLNGERIYHGKLPPLLYAVGVLRVEVGRRGEVLGLDWMRAPSHAPEVVAEIERTVRLAAPFPAPARLGRVTYTDTWLWDRSGRFQLDTLTEGQLGA